MKEIVGSGRGLFLRGTGYPSDRPADHNRDDVQEVGKEIAFLSKNSLKFMSANCETLPQSLQSWKKLKQNLRQCDSHLKA